MKNLLIDLLAFAALFSSVLVITSKNPVIAVIFLISLFILVYLFSINKLILILSNSFSKKLVLFNNSIDVILLTIIILLN